MRMLPHLFVAGLAVLLLVAVALAHRYMPEESPVLFQTLIHSLHGPGFAVVAVLIFIVLRLYRRAPINYLHAAAGAMAIGVLAEASQIPGPRDAEIVDLVVNGIGITGGLGFIAMFDREIRALLGRKNLLIMVAISFAALIFALTPSAWYTYSLVAQKQALPMLLSFDHAWEKAVYSQPGRRRVKRVDAPSNWPQRGTVAYAEESGRYGILMRMNAYPDWTGYSQVSFIAASGDDRTQKIALSIRDFRHEGEQRSVWYSERLYIGPEPTTITIPLEKIAAMENGRPFNMAQVETLILSAGDPGTDVSLYFDNFRLD